jgi:hypothetical protein
MPARPPLVLLAVCLLAVVAPLAAATPMAPQPATPTPQSALDGPSDGPAAPEVSTTANTTNYVDVSDGARPAYSRGGLDVAGAVAVSSDRLRARHDAIRLRRSVEAAETPAVRRAVVRDELAAIRARTAALHERHAAAVQGYQNGSRSTGQFLRALARIDAAAGGQTALAILVRNRLPVSTDLSLPSALDTGFHNVQGDLVALRGPVRDRVQAQLAGADTGGAIYVLAGQEGVVLATVGNGRYVREATDTAATQPGQPDTFATADRPLFAVLERTVALYPWAGNNTLRSSNTGFGNSSLYQSRIVHPQGNLTAYLDGTTTDVAREIQFKRLETVSRRTTLENETDRLRLSVNATHPTGPAHVRVQDATTGGAVDARLRINGSPVGRTGLDGELWVVQPNRAMRVNATTDEGATVIVGG